MVPWVCSAPPGCSRTWAHWETCWGCRDLPANSLVCITLEWPFSEASLMFDCYICRTSASLVTYATPSGWWRLVRRHLWRTHLYLCWQIQSHTHMKMHLNRHIMNVHRYFPGSQAKTLSSFLAHPCYWEQTELLRVQEACSESVPELNRLNGWLTLT